MFVRYGTPEVAPSHLYSQYNVSEFEEIALWLRGEIPLIDNRLQSRLFGNVREILLETIILAFSRVRINAFHT